MALSSRLRRELAHCQVFLIDDEPLIVETLSSMLVAAGFYNVHGFTNSRDAINMLRCLRPDLILTDIHMPEVSGSMLTRLIREFEHLTAIPIVAITADDSEETAQQILAEGANSVLLKPVCEQLLIERISALHSIAF